MVPSVKHLQESFLLISLDLQPAPLLTIPHWFDKGLATKCSASDELVPGCSKISGSYNFNDADGFRQHFVISFCHPILCKLLNHLGSLSPWQDLRRVRTLEKGNRLKSKRKKHHIISYNVLRKAAWTTLTFAEIHTSMFKMFTFIYHCWCAPTNDDNSWNILWPEWQMRRLPALLAACLGELCKCAGPMILSTSSLWTYILHARNSCPQRNHPNWKVFGSITYHSMPFISV